MLATMCGKQLGMLKAPNPLQEDVGRQRRQRLGAELNKLDRL